jgi:hypothetical protein
MSHNRSTRRIMRRGSTRKVSNCCTCTDEPEGRGWEVHPRDESGGREGRRPNRIAIGDLPRSGGLYRPSGFRCVRTKHDLLSFQVTWSVCARARRAVSAASPRAPPKVTILSRASRSTATASSASKCSADNQTNSPVSRRVSTRSSSNACWIRASSRCRSAGV